MRKITYAQAINEGLNQAMELSEKVYLMGQLVDFKPGIFGTTTGLADKYGAHRVLDFPVAENLMTASAIGSALQGMRPVVCHQRLDFMMYSMDQIVNWMALWYFKSGAKSSLPVTIRAVVGKGWGQGPQHSKSMHAWFAHLPGVTVAVPSTPYDAKGLLLESIFGEKPVVILENRSLFSMKGAVPESAYRVRFGKAAVRKKGSDVTIVSIGNLVPASVRAASSLAKQGISAEVIDLRTVAPIDFETINKSVKKTGRLVVCDPDWYSVSVASEVIASVMQENGISMKSNPIRITLPDSHTPMSYVLEDKYYISDQNIENQVRSLF